MFVRRGALPTQQLSDASAQAFGNDDQVNVQNAATGDWYIGVYGFGAYSGVSLTVDTAQVVPLNPGDTVPNLSGSEDVAVLQDNFRQAAELPRMTTSGGTGEADVYCAARSTADAGGLRRGGTGLR